MWPGGGSERVHDEGGAVGEGDLELWVCPVRRERCRAVGAVHRSTARRSSAGRSRARRSAAGCRRRTPGARAGSSRPDRRATSRPRRIRRTWPARSGRSPYGRSPISSSIQARSISSCRSLWATAPSTPIPPAFDTAATTSRQWLKARIGTSMPNISVMAVRMTGVCQGRRPGCEPQCGEAGRTTVGP